MATGASPLRAALQQFRLGRLAEAAALCEVALQRPGEEFGALHLLGVIAGREGRLDASEDWLTRAAALNPKSGEVLLNLGITLERAGRFDAATDCYRRAIAADPDFAGAHAALGTRLMAVERHDEALASFERAVALDPLDAKALSHVVLLRRMLCAWDRLAAHEAALAAAVRARSPGVLPYVLLAVADDPALQRDCAREAFAGIESVAPPIVAPGPEGRKLRLAYLSADFRDHATTFLIAKMLELHDRDRFEIFAYSYGRDDDSAMRRRIERAVSAFVDVRTCGDDEIARQLRERKIDIAIDLNGRTQAGRMGILARRAAPIQVHYIGYPGTLGADFVDYFLADPFVVPPESRGDFVERIVDLPGSYQVNDRDRPIADPRPTRAACGLPPGGFVFCCFNAAYKISPQVFDIWMRLLRDVPGSVLWLLPGNRWAAVNLRRAAVARGVDPQRLVFAPHWPMSAHLARNRLADLFLDTLPCNAHTTASDALWAGLPVLTCAGRSFAARVAGSLLRAVGLPELITADLGAYQDLALQLARNPDELGVIRRKLAASIVTAPLFDTERTTRAIEAAYLKMWEIYRRGEAPRAFAVR